jgi:hypothetical protein
MRIGRALAVCAVIAAGMPGCEGDETTGLTTTSTSGPGGSGGGGSTPVAPAAGLPGCAQEFVDDDGVCRPELADCPAGSIPQLANGCVTVGVVDCDPIFVGADGLCLPHVADCPMGSFPVPTEGCVPIDGADGCGTGTFGAIPDDPGTVYVDAAFVGTSDGSKAAPYTTLAAALAAVGRGEQVAVAAGTYDEPVVPARAVTLRGRCASMVRIQGVAPQVGGDAIVYLGAAASGSTIRGVAIGGAGRGVVVDDAVASIQEIHVDGAAGAAIQVLGASAVATVDHTFVAETVALGMQPGYGLELDGGGQLTVTASAVYHARAIGVAAAGTGSTLGLDDVLVEATQVASDAVGIDIEASADATVDNTVVVEHKSAGVAVLGGTLALHGSVVADDHDATYGTAILAQGAGTTAQVESSALVDGSVAGILVYTGAGITARGSLIAHTSHPNESFGVSVLGVGTSAVLEDCAVTDHMGVGAGAFDGGTLSASGTLFEGIVAGSDPLIAPGEGVLSSGNGSKVMLGSCAVTANQTWGVIADQGGVMEVDHSLVRGTLPAPNGSYGVGVALVAAGPSKLSGTLVEDSVGIGVWLLGTNATLTDSHVRGVAMGTAAFAPAPFAEVGEGVLLQASALGASADLGGCRIEGAARAGVAVSAAAGTLAGSYVTGNAYGVVLQDAAPFTVAPDTIVEGNGEDRPEGLQLPLP